MLLLPTISAYADCTDEYFSKHGGGRTLSEMRNDPEYRTCRGEALNQTKPAKIARPLAVSALPANSSPKLAPPLPPPIATNFYPMLRRDFDDVWLFDKRKGVSDIADAEGAEFAWASDRVAGNSTWSAHALGAVVYQRLSNRYGPEPDFIGLSLAPFVQIDRVRNSNPNSQTNNLDTITFGGSTEIGFDMLGGSHYFRARGAAVSDRISDTSSGSGVLEWIPVYDRLLNSPFGVASLPFVFVFGPEIKVRYDNVIVDDATGDKSYLWRTGPQAALRYKIVSETLPAFLNSFHGQTTYSWLTADHNQTFSYFNTSVTYNLDPEGYLGLTGSYTKGRSEDTGRKVDLWKASLTGKL
jgi:hypothetical protein